VCDLGIGLAVHQEGGRQKGDRGRSGRIPKLLSNVKLCFETGLFAGGNLMVGIISSSFDEAPQLLLELAGGTLSDEVDLYLTSLLHGQRRVPGVDLDFVRLLH